MGRKIFRYGSIAAAVAVGVWAIAAVVDSGGPVEGPVVSAPTAVAEPSAPYFLDDLPGLGERIEAPPLRVIEAPLPAAGTSDGTIRPRTGVTEVRSAEGQGRRRLPSA